VLKHLPQVSEVLPARYGLEFLLNLSKCRQGRLDGLPPPAAKSVIWRRLSPGSARRET